MKTAFSLISALLLFASCGNQEPENLQKSSREVPHLGENSFHFDSTLVSEKDTDHYSIDLKPVPGHFVMGRLETDSFLEAHLYEDMYLVFKRNEDSLYISKDSLTDFINEAYLNEALMEDVHLMIFEPSVPLYLFEFAVRKPMEEDRFHFQVLVDKDQHQINIVDE